MSIPYRNEKLVKPREYSLKLERWYGLNCADERISDGEFVRMKNISCNGQHVYPRAPRSVVTEGIDNPSKILFCGGKLSYIAKGKLYIQNGSVFEDKGDVGLVTSYTEFSDKETLFFPGNTVYNNETDSVSAITAYLSKQKGYYNQENEYVADPTPTNVSKYEGVTMSYKGNGFQYQYVSPIAIVGSDESNYIYPPALKDANGKGITENGKKKYAGISINISGTCISNSGLTDHSSANSSVCLGVFVHAWDEDGELLTKRTGSTTHFEDFKIGDTISFDGKAAKLLVQLGYFKVTYSTKKGGTCFECDSECLAKRDTDFNNSNFKVWLSESTYPAPNSRPYIAYACTDNNRVVGVSKNSFYASSLGDYTNWVDFVDADGNPKETGAYAEKLNTAGDFTGCVKYAGNVVLTKADMIYLCYGNKPPYRIVEIAKIGCIDGRSIAECGGYLYFLGRDGIYRFSGGVPVLISQKLDKNFVSGCGVSVGKKYYCCAYDGEGHELYCLDTERGTWHVEDDREYISFAAHGNELYGLTAQGEIIKFNSGNDAVKWEFTTKQFDFDTDYTKNLAKVYCRLKLYGQAWTDIYIRSSKTDWHKFANIKANGENVIQAKCKVKKCDFIQLKFRGKGQCEIMDIYADITVGTKKHRAGKNLTVFRK